MPRVQSCLLALSLHRLRMMYARKPFEGLQAKPAMASRVAAASWVVTVSPVVMVEDAGASGALVARSEVVAWEVAVRVPAHLEAVGMAGVARVRVAVDLVTEVVAMAAMMEAVGKARVVARAVGAKEGEE